MTPWTVAHHVPPSMGFSRQEYWSGLPFPSPEDLPNPGIEPGLPHCRQTLYCLSQQGSPNESRAGLKEAREKEQWEVMWSSERTEEMSKRKILITTSHDAKRLGCVKTQKRHHRL